MDGVWRGKEERRSRSERNKRVENSFWKKVFLKKAFLEKIVSAVGLCSFRIFDDAIHFHNVNKLYDLARAGSLLPCDSSRAT